MIGIDNLDLSEKYNASRITKRQYLDTLKRRVPRIRPPYGVYIEPEVTRENTND